MNRRHRAFALVIAGTLLTGCASSKTGATQAGGVAPSPAMSAGMVMPDGSTMGADAQSPVATSGPSPAEQMICAPETRSTIKKVLGLAHVPASSATWRDYLYTCTYRLPMGTLIVSVKQSASPVAAETYFRKHQITLGPTQMLDGLGQGSYGTKAGTVVLLKDSDTLTIDATRLPAVFGKQRGVSDPMCK